MIMVLKESSLIDFKNFLITEEKTKNTIDKYLRDVMKFFGFISNKKICDKADVVAFKQELLGTYKASSINSILVAVNQFLEFAGHSENKVKMLKLQRRILCEESKELTKEEYERLLRGSMKEERLYVLLQTICSTGIRVSEHKYITVERLKEGRVVINNKGKTRIIFIPKKLRIALLSYCKRKKIVEGPVFITKSGKPLNRSNIWRMMKKLCDEVNVSHTKVFPHNLRHLFALTYYRLKKDIVRLADLLGHSSIETTRIYTLTTGHEYENELSQMNLIYL